MADVIAQVANLPVSEITISLIQRKLAVFFQEMFETFTEDRIVEWTKKVRQAGTLATRHGHLQALVAWQERSGYRDPETESLAGLGAHSSGLQRGGFVLGRGTGQVGSLLWRQHAVPPREGGS